MRGIIFLTALFSALSVGATQDLWLLEDFERGVRRWGIKSSRQAGEGLAPAEIGTFPTGAPDGGKFAGLFLWRRAREGEWVRFLFPLDGVTLSAKKTVGLTFWWVGDGSDTKVTFTLFAEKDDEQRLFRKVLSLPTAWQQEKIFWTDFRDEEGRPIGVFVRYLKALWIEKIGPFDPFFFAVDNLSALVPKEPRQFLRVRVVVDFGQEIGVNLLRWGSNWDEKALKVLDTLEGRQRILALRLGWARVRTSDLLRGRSFEGAVRWVIQWARRVQALGMVPVVNLSPIRPEDLAAGIFIQQALFWAKRLFPTVKIFEVFQNPSEPPLHLDPEVCAIHFSSVIRALKRVSPMIQVGGWGEGAAWRRRFLILFARSPRPDFFSIHFYGTHNASTTDPDLMRSARETVTADLPDQVPLNRLPEWLKRLYPPEGIPLEVTECSLNALRTPDGKALEKRLQSDFGAAWFATLFVQMVGKAESLVQYKLVGDGWGLLDEEGNPRPTYWTVWACNTYFPPGTRLVAADSNYAPLLVLAGKTLTANNLLLVNTGAEGIEVTVEAVGLPEIKGIRVRKMRGERIPRYRELEPSFTLHLKLFPYQTAVIQFIP